VQQDRSLKEIQFALGVSLIWRGEAQFKEGQAKAALESFRNAVSRFEDAGDGSNAARIGLAVGHTQMASALAALGETQEASAEYRKALAILEPQSTSLSARYAYADVYFEAGEVSRKLAERPEATSIERRQLWSDASDWYQKSADASGKIQNPGLVSPQGFTYHGPAQAARAILSCKRAIRQLAQSTR
jgi:tetratricopeptide (TPR) repeat protein